MYILNPTALVPSRDPPIYSAVLPVTLTAAIDLDRWQKNAFSDPLVKRRFAYRELLANLPDGQQSIIWYFERPERLPLKTLQHP